MTDIIELAKQAGFELILNKLSVRDNMNRQIDLHEKLTKFAQLLQQGEAVAEPPDAFYWADETGKPVHTSAFLGQPVPFAIANAKSYGHHAVLLYRTPPNLQAKLDKAREALQDICNKDVRQLRSAEVIAQQALKDIE